MSSDQKTGLPQLVITDIDGVWTDGGMYYDQSGNEWKKFNTSDSAGVLFLQMLNIPIAILTGEETTIVARRAEKLGIEMLHQGVKNKLKVAEKLIQELQLDWDDVAYIGDDLNDMELLQAVGKSACPISAPDYIQALCDEVIQVKGGDGAFRAFVESKARQAGLMDQLIAHYNSER